MERLGVKAIVARLNDDPDPADDKLFQQIIYSTLKTGLMDKDQMANGLLVSSSFIDIWSRGRKLPNKLVRGELYGYLLDRIESRLSAEITVLKEVLEKANPSLANLMMYLSICLEYEYVDINEIAKKMEVTPLIVKHWANGTAKPRPILISLIFKVLLEKVNQPEDNRQK